MSPSRVADTRCAALRARARSIVAELLRAGANPSRGGWLLSPAKLTCASFAPLAAAVRNGDLASTRRLLQAGADVNFGLHSRSLLGFTRESLSPLFRAASSGHVPLVKVRARTRAAERRAPRG